MGMSSDYVWVVGFDASTGKAMQFIRCHKNSAPFYESLYACEGYSVQTMTSEEFGEPADRGGFQVTARFRCWQLPFPRQGR